MAADEAQKEVFWLVKYQDRPDAVRISTDKHMTARKACIDAFGMVSHTMMVKPIGANRAKIRTTSWRTAQINDPNGWYRPELWKGIEQLGAPRGYVAGPIKEPVTTG